MIGQAAELVSMNGDAPAVVGGIGGAAMRGLRHGTEGPAAFWHDVGGSYDDLGSVTGREPMVASPRLPMRGAGAGGLATATGSAIGRSSATNTPDRWRSSRNPSLANCS